MERWNYPGFFSKKSRSPKVSSGQDNDAGEAGEASGSTPAGDTATSGSGDAGSSSNIPASGSSQRQETPGSGSRNIENIPSTSGASASSSKPSGGKPKPPSLTLQTGKSSTKVNKTAGPPHAKSPSSPPKQEPTESLKSGLKDLSKKYPEGISSPLGWDDGGPAQEGKKKPKGQVRFGNVDVREISGSSGSFRSTPSQRDQAGGSTKPESERDYSPTSSFSPSSPSSLARRSPQKQGRDERGRGASASPSSLARKPSPTRRRSGGRFSSSLSPNPRGRKGNEEEDASSMRPMSPPRSRDTEKPRWAEKYAAFSKWKTKQEWKNAPESSEPARPLTQNEARNQTAWRTPHEAMAARESELAAREGKMIEKLSDLLSGEERRRERERSRDRAVEAAIRHEEEERGKATGVEASTSASRARQARRRSVDSKSRSPHSAIQDRDAMESDRRGSAGRSGSAGHSSSIGRSSTTRERPQGQPQGQSRGQSQEQSGGGPENSPTGSPGGSPGGGGSGGPGGDPRGDPEGNSQTPRGSDKPEKKPKDCKKDTAKKSSCKDRFLTKYRARVLKPKNGKLTKVPDRYRQAKSRELEAMSVPEKRLRKLLQIKRRLNQYGMLATVVTSVYLICFGVAWQEHHRWNNHDKEERPRTTSPFAMWCVCLVWICMATALNMLAIRTIFKLWLFGRKYKTWSYGEWKWQLFSKAGLVICILIGGVTLASFGGTVTMLREARTLEIERGYYVP
ncbi:hypothetical protein TWF191_010247 [Orbilia oligospora]|uniref:Uncharacterized protein n=1 Tax=Orbilia oligospora TaxID=2813651 RepID=A0A7C8R1W2_ORBOL|nr:hypothetical protein TWF191_010247 [Orbilia oligospora]